MNDENQSEFATPQRTLLIQTSTAVAVAGVRTATWMATACSNKLHPEFQPLISTNERGSTEPLSARADNPPATRRPAQEGHPERGPESHPPFARSRAWRGMRRFHGCARLKPARPARRKQSGPRWHSASRPVL